MIGQAIMTVNALKRIILALAVAVLMAAMLVTSTNSANAKNSMPVNPGQQGSGKYSPPQASGAFKGKAGGSEVLHSPSGGLHVWLTSEGRLAVRMVGAVN